MALEDAGLGQRHREVERRLAAEPGEQAVRPLARDHRLDRVDGQRLEVDGVGDVGVGHDRRRVGVDEDRPDALLAQRAAGLRAGVVELGRLADDDRPGAEDQDRRAASALRRPGRRPSRDRHAPAPAAATNRSNTASASSGPGRALGVVLDRLDRQRRVAQALDRAVVQVQLADVEAATPAGSDVADDLDLVVLGGDLDAARGRGPGPGGSRRGGRTGAGSSRRRRPGATIWWPRQIPSSGRPSSMTARASATGPASRAGSPGPGERTSAVDVAAPAPPTVEIVCGRIRTRAPRRRIAADDVRLQPEVDDRRRAARRRPPRRRRMIDDGETWPTKSWSSQRGTARARSTAASRSTNPGSVTIAAQAAVRAQVAGERPRVDAGDRRDARRRGAATRAGGRRRGPRPSRWRRRAPGATAGRDWSSSASAAVVADQRVGHDDDLAGVRGVGADLLVAGLRGVDDEVAAGRVGGPERDPREDGAVLEREQRRAERRRRAGRRSSSARGSGGAEPAVGAADRRRSPAPHMKTPPARRARWTRGHTVDRPPFRPHGTGSPASRDRPSRMARRVAGSMAGRRPGFAADGPAGAAVPGQAPTATRTKSVAKATNRPTSSATFAAIGCGELPADAPSSR